MKAHITQEILFDYFAGRATAFQKQQIEEWTKDTENLESFYAHLAQYESQNVQFVADSDMAFEKHRFRIQQIITPLLDEAENIDEPTRTSPWYRWIIAASVLMLAGLSFLFKDEILFQHYHTEFGQTQSIQLTDGSQVTLNANSTLKVPRFGFGQDTREVFLTGEAEFVVKHTIDNQLFKVKTQKGFEITVLGTEFTVYARQRGGKVVLNKGKVQLRYHDKTDQLLTMKPGDWVVFDGKGHANLKKTTQPQVHSAWKEHRFIFDGTPFSELAYLFQENFGVMVQIGNDELAQWKISGSFTAQTAEELLETLTEASDLTFRKEKNVIIIEPAN
ncbi:MAG: FecR domain-containing protein [Spirosomataceae bacterium]